MGRIPALSGPGRHTPLQRFLKFAPFAITIAYRTCALGGFCKRIWRSALRAAFLNRPVPEYKIAVRIAGATEKDFAAARFALQNFTRAAFFGAAYAGGFHFDIFAVRIIGTGSKFPETTVFDYKFFSADRTVLVKRDVIFNGNAFSGFDYLFGVFTFRIA